MRCPIKPQDAHAAAVKAHAVDCATEAARPSDAAMRFARAFSKCYAEPPGCVREEGCPDVCAGQVDIARAVEAVWKGVEIGSETQS